MCSARVLALFVLQVLKVVCTRGVPASVAKNSLRLMCEQITKVQAGAGRIGAEERTRRFSLATFRKLPVAEQEQHSWIDCAVCLRDRPARRLLGFVPIPGRLLGLCAYLLSMHVIYAMLGASNHKRPLVLFAQLIGVACEMRIACRCCV